MQLIFTGKWVVLLMVNVSYNCVVDSMICNAYVYVMYVICDVSAENIRF